MVRRVKAYLKSMKVITDEEELHRMSQEVEPPSGGLAPAPLPVLNTVCPDQTYHLILSSLFQVRKRNPSPSPSAASSSSSTPSHYSHGTEDKRLQYLAGAPNKFGKLDTSAQQTLNVSLNYYHYHYHYHYH